MHHIQRQIVESSWTYPGWEEDVNEAKESCYVSLFKYDLEKCQVKQMIHDNDYSRHPALIKLGGIQLSYPDWEADVEDAKRYICLLGYTHGAKGFNEKIEGMQNKQNVYNGVRMGITQNKAESRDNTFGNCKVCWDSASTHAFVPCGEIVMFAFMLFLKIVHFSTATLYIHYCRAPLCLCTMWPAVDEQLQEDLPHL